MICAFAGRLSGAHKPCWGRGQDHHCIPRQTLKQRLSRLAYEGQQTPPLKTVIEDERNLVKVCVHHHQLIEGRRIYVTREMLPEGIDDFAGELGLWWYLERYYATTTGPKARY